MIPSYSSTLYDPTIFKVRVDRAVETLRASGVQFSHIAVRGSSGAIFGGALSVALGKPLVYVRKPEREENSHGYSRLEGIGHMDSWIFVDDFIGRGRTLRAVRDGIQEHGDGLREFKGVLTYQDGDLGYAERFYPAASPAIVRYLERKDP